jgi:5-carboxymethyl-2-hydroxymuconate isomerase
MPIINIKYSKNLDLSEKWRDICVANHYQLSEIMDAEIQNCKTFFFPVEDYVFAAGNIKKEAFVHVEVSMLDKPDRTDAEYDVLDRDFQANIREIFLEKNSDRPITFIIFYNRIAKNILYKSKFDPNEQAK